MTLFEVDCGGATYWVAAKMPEDCAGLIRAADGYDPEGDGEDPPDIVAHDKESAEMFRICDDSGERLGPGSLWTAFESMDAPGVVACSEWP